MQKTKTRYSRYRKISVKLWRNGQFQKFSAGAKLLHFFISTCAESIILPGVLCMSPLAIADSMRSDLNEQGPFFKELQAGENPWLEVSEQERLVFLPYAMKENVPDNPNVTAAWRAAFDELPDCELKDTIEKHVVHLLETECDVSFLDAWRTQGAKVRRSARIPQKIAIAARERDQNACRYCGVAVNWSDRKSNSRGTLDHIDPAGGDSLDNVAVCCGGCNSKKAMRTPEQAGMSLRTITDKSVHDHGSDQNTTKAAADGFTEHRWKQEKEPNQKQNQNKEPNQRTRPTPGTLGAFLTPFLLEAETARRVMVKWGVSNEDAKAIVDRATRDGLNEYELEKRIARVRFVVRRNSVIHRSERAYVGNIPSYILTERYPPAQIDVNVTAEALQRERELMTIERTVKSVEAKDKQGSEVESRVSVPGLQGPVLSNA